MNICLQLRKQQVQSRENMLANIYGSALPARMQIERQILRRYVGECRIAMHTLRCVKCKEIVHRNLLSE